jgi:protein tyrosine phosphatase (PTP) superfamily phosphohydrolase (DUF442 family)
LFVACASAPLPKNPPAIEVTNARQPIAGVTTGGKPSEAQLRQAKELGYRTVISLLPEAEMQGEAEEVRALGMRFVSIPIANAGALTEENAQRLAAAMDAPASKPLLLHCASGNRAGALLALKVFYMDAATRADALELGTRAGMTSLRPDVEAKMLAHEQQR